MKKVLIFLYVFVLIVFAELLITFVINEVYIYKYEKGNYDKGLVKSLFVLNYNERYIPYYNYGNYLYKTGDYKNAALEYEKALEKNVPDKRVCMVRINLSLSLMGTVSDDMTDDEKIEIYEKAKNVLYEDNCAEEGQGQGGSSEESEELEDEIQEKEDEIEEGKSSGEKDDDGNSDPEKEKEEKEKEEEKSKELEDRNKDANKNRQEGLDDYRDLDDREYYYGKKW